MGRGGGVLGGLILLGLGCLLHRHRSGLEEVWAVLRSSWDSFDEAAPEFKGMEFWNPHQLALCRQPHYLPAPSASLHCHLLRYNGIVPARLELLNEFPIIAIFHQAVPRRLLQEMDHHSYGSNATREIFDPYKLSGYLEGARIVNQRHVPHRLNPQVEAVTNITEALTGLSLDWSSREWKLVSYGPGYHHSLHTDFLYPTKQVRSKTLAEVYEEAVNFFRRRCIGNSRHLLHSLWCGLKTLKGAAESYWAPSTVENESYRTVDSLGNRAMAVIVYANDDYEGGKTIFPTLNVTVQGEAGDLAVFPIATPEGGMDPDMMHAACPLSQGRKLVNVFMIRERGQEQRLLCPWDVNAYDASSFTQGPIADAFPRL